MKQMASGLRGVTWGRIDFAHTNIGMVRRRKMNRDFYFVSEARIEKNAETTR